MKHAKTALAALIATAFVGTAAFAQSNASTPPGATTVKPEVTAPASPAPSADVKADAKAAKKQPKGDAALSEVKGDTKAVTQSGETPKGDAELKIKH